MRGSQVHTIKLAYLNTKKPTNYMAFDSFGPRMWRTGHDLWSSTKKHPKFINGLITLPTILLLRAGLEPDNSK